MRWIALLVLSTALLVAVACGGGDSSGSAGDSSDSAGDSSHRIVGTFTLTDASNRGDVGDSCRGSGGYTDITPGAQVVVMNQDGTILGTGRLGAGSFVPFRGTTLTISSKCEFPFTVASLPKAQFYSVAVSHRGEITYSFQDLESSRWEVDITLGR